MINPGNRKVLLLIAIVGIVAIFAAFGNSDAPPRTTVDPVDFSSASYRYDDSLQVHFIPHSQDPARYTVTYEIRKSIPETNHTDIVTVEYEEARLYENVSASSPIIFHVPGKDRSRYLVTAEIRDDLMRVVHNSSLSVTPVEHP
jgi:hypothetical protein